MPLDIIIGVFFFFFGQRELKIRNLVQVLFYLLSK